MTTNQDRETRALSLDELKFGPDGLIVSVVQDATDGQVLMVAYMNRESVERTLRDRRTWFYSRSRQRYWMKGEESGNVQEVVSVAYDCDADALLVRVNQLGSGVACHTGARSCFYRELPLGSVTQATEATGEAEPHSSTEKGA